jgi:hypothetical protein
VAVPSALVRSALVVLVAPSSEDGSVAARGDGRAVVDAAALCAEARRLGRDTAVVWCGHPARELSVPAASLVVACWSPAPAMVRAAGRWLVRRV